MAAQWGHIPDNGYLPRVSDKTLNHKLHSSEAVCIQGPKWCGKTRTGIRHSASQVFMQDPDRGPIRHFSDPSIGAAVLGATSICAVR